jgi:SAM-dependent methyltransferase
MLNKADARRIRAALVCAPAEALPFEPNSLDLIFCVNAAHHFSNLTKFFPDRRLLLRRGGRIAIFGLDPHAKGTEWYQYEYFSGVREQDLARYLPHAQLRRLMTGAGFRNVGTNLAEHIQKRFAGEDVLNDPFLAANVRWDAQHSTKCQRVSVYYAELNTRGSLPFPLFGKLCVSLRETNRADLASTSLLSSNSFNHCGKPRNQLPFFRELGPHNPICHSASAMRSS